MDDHQDHDPPVPDVPTRLSQALAERTPGHGHFGCDAFNPCASCQAAREAVVLLSALSPQHRPSHAS